MQVADSSGRVGNSYTVDCRIEVPHYLEENFRFSVLECSNFQLIGFRVGCRRIPAHINLDDVTLFIIPWYRLFKGIGGGSIRASTSTLSQLGFRSFMVIYPYVLGNGSVDHTW